MINANANANGNAIAARFPLPAVRTAVSGKLVLAAALVGLADWLFFRHPVGISAAVFLVFVAVGVLAANPARATRRELMAGARLLLAALLPLVEEAGPLSLLFAASSIALFGLIVAARPSGPWHEKLAEAWRLLLAGPFRLPGDLVHARRAALRRGAPPFAVSGLGAWLVPLGFTAVFVGLFAAANPLIEGWLSGISLARTSAIVDGWRLLFWAAALLAVWPFVHLRAIRRVKMPALALESEVVPPEVSRVIFGAEAILRSLILFNLIFAVQTVMDMAYLWGGVALPAGMTYAAYAHRGAYPLIVTALLAAAFVLAAMRPGGAAQQSRPLRIFVFLWIGQNVLLVLSSILRLDLYVAIYSLTYWRIAAFIWMALVACGLVLIVARIVLGRSNNWLISANAVALALTLYACSFVDFPLLIGGFNVAHRQEAAAKGAALDLGYLGSLGAQAIPAMDVILHEGPSPATVGLARTRESLALAHRTRMRDWRAWGFRDWRLKRYLKAQAALKAAAAGASGDSAAP
jgi:hypothetical protein